MKKWQIPIVVTSGLLIIFFLILLLLGYRPIKADSAIVDWQGTTTIVQALSVLALVGTVIYQVINNKTIAKRQEELTEQQIENNKQFAARQQDLLKQQNDIALFDRRYEAYFVISLVFGSAQHYEANVQKVYSILDTLIAHLNKAEVSSDISPYMFNYAVQFENIEFLFEGVC